MRSRCGVGLGMHDDQVGAGLGEGLEIGVGRRDHQVGVEAAWSLCGAERLHDVRAEGDVGHEMAVHHVEMDPVRAGLVDRAHLLAQAGEVGGEDRGSDEDHRS